MGQSGAAAIWPETGLQHLGGPATLARVARAAGNWHQTAGWAAKDWALTLRMLQLGMGALNHASSESVGPCMKHDFFEN